MLSHAHTLGLLLLGLLLLRAGGARTQSLVLLVDLGSEEAVQRAKEIVSGTEPGEDNFMLGTFHSNGLAGPRALGGWRALQEAVRCLEPLPGAAAGPLGPLDAVLGAARAARDARVLLLTGTAAAGEDGAPGSAGRAAAALREGRTTVDAWGAGACWRYLALRTLTEGTGGHLCCGGEGRHAAGTATHHARAALQVAELRARQDGAWPAGAGAEREGVGETLVAPHNGSVRELGAERSAASARTDSARRADGDAELLDGTARPRKGDIQTRAAVAVDPGATLTKSDGILLLQPAVTIEMGRQSQLNVQPGQTVTLSFELTNNRLVPLRFQFRLKDERAYLRTLRPVEALVLPNQPLQVEATLFIPQNTPDGQSDQVTLVAFSPYEETRKSALISVGQQFTNDNWNPTVSWAWKHRCVGAWDQSTCSTNTWTIEFTIQDRDSGTLSIVTIPKGVQFRDEFTSGTREPVKAYYSASCCSKRVDLVVTDVRGNTYRDTFDAGSEFLDIGERAAVGLAVICILLIVLVIVFFIMLCRRRESRSLERSLRSRDL